MRSKLLPTYSNQNSSIKGMIVMQIMAKVAMTDPCSKALPRPPTLVKC